MDTLPTATLMTIQGTQVVREVYTIYGVESQGLREHLRRLLH